MLENLAKDFYYHTHPGTDVPDNLSVDSWEDYVSKLAYARKKPRSTSLDGTGSGKDESSSTSSSSSAQSIVNSIKSFAKSACNAITKADDFINDPVGSVTKGLGDALSDYKGTIPKTDLTSVHDNAIDAINKVAKNVGPQLVKGITDWIGNALSPLIGKDSANTLSNTVSSMAASASDKGVSMASQFVNKAYDTTKGWADKAGVSLDSLSSDALGKALDQGIGQVKNIANKAIGSAVGTVINQVPGLKSGLDTAKAICQMNPAGVLKGLFNMAVDGLNSMTGGLLTPISDGIKGLGAGLIGSVFNNDAKDGKTQVEEGRSK